MTPREEKEPARRQRGRRERWLRGLGLTLLAVAVAATPGCWGKRELEERSFVTLLGIDHSLDGRILATAVIGLPRGTGAGGSMGGGPAGTSTLLISGAGRNIEEAMREMELISSRELSTVYMAFLILGEEFARTDVGPVVDVFSRHLHYKPNTLLAVCEGRAYDFLAGFRPEQEAQPGEYLLKLVSTTYDGLGGCPMATMHDLSVGFTAVGADPWASYLGLSPVAPAEAGSTTGGGGDAEAGGDTRQRDKDTEMDKRVARVLGSALFAKVGQVYKMVGSLDPLETMAALLMDDELHTTIMNVALPGDQAETTLVLHHTRATVEVAPKEDPPRADFRVVMTASVSEARPGELLPEMSQGLRQALVRTAQEQLLALLHKTFAKLTSLNSDVAGLGAHAKGSFGTYGEWENFDWAQRYSATVASFDVRVHIFTAGFTIQRPRLR